jgi:predicted SnoaL-like aldol condensation-catalyzing enzyme
MAQVKFVIDDELLKKFKQIVIKKHGKIQLTSEGEDAIRLYIKKYERLITNAPPGKDPLVKVIGSVRTGKAHNVLRELKELESNP